MISRISCKGKGNAFVWATKNRLSRRLMNVDDEVSCSGSHNVTRMCRTLGDIHLTNSR